MTFDDLQVSDLACTGDKVMLNVGKLLNEDQINRAISVLQFIRFIKNI